MLDIKKIVQKVYDVLSNDEPHTPLVAELSICTDVRVTVAPAASSTILGNLPRSLENLTPSRRAPPHTPCFLHLLHKRKPPSHRHLGTSASSLPISIFRSCYTPLVPASRPVATTDKSQL